MSVCILSGLEIPKGRHTVEHYVPRSRAPSYITGNKRNIFPAEKTINNIKGNLLPCEFERLKYVLSYHAIRYWHIKQTDKEFVLKAIENWNKGYAPDYCNLCLLNCKERQR